MNNIRRTLLLFVSLCMLLGLSAREFTKNDIKLNVVPTKQFPKFRVLKIQNCYDADVIVSIINEDDGGKSELKLGKNEIINIDLTCTVIMAGPINGKRTEIYRIKNNEAKAINDIREKPKEEPKEDFIDALKEEPKEEQFDRLIETFKEYLQKYPFYSDARIAEDTMSINEHIEKLLDPYNTEKNRYIQDKKIKDFVNAHFDSVGLYLNQHRTVIDEFLKKNRRLPINDQEVCRDTLSKYLMGLRQLRYDKVQELNKIIKDAESTKELEEEVQTGTNWKTIMVIGGTVLLVLALLAWYLKVSKKEKNARAKSNSSFSDSSVDSNAIVVRNTTNVVMRKQSLDDVIGNEAYMKIDTKDFCADSAVRTMYLKNTCIKDIYNMYAEDLRNPDKPKEDGCMVLGRWVLDETTNTYDISLEHVVLPGNDAIFAEYELNFGGKIKMKVSEMLRKLRRETDLQYDLTCWIHSHPGLGVFFSQSDDNVHLQLKNAHHPDILTAMVVDILTPQQEVGIFTFRSDSTINAKPDLTKMYSLEDMYKWAVASERKSYRPEDHFNALADAKTHTGECQAIELSNGAIIDMALLSDEQKSGFVGFVHGFSIQKGDNTIHIVAKVDVADVVADHDMIGCFVVAPHCSIPSIRKVVAKYLDKVHFVLVYTASDGLLTSIPIIKHDLCSNEDYYGEQKLEDLKIWTRRKR